MKKDFLTTTEVESFLPGKTYEAKVVTGNQQKLLLAFSERLYSDPIGSMVREVVSNAWDATVEAGVEEPVIVSLTEEADQIIFRVTDFGTGMSEQVMTEVFLNFLSSTRETSENVNGFWGLGSKSPLAYREFFMVDTVQEGILCKYIYRKSETGFSLQELGKEETVNPNGTSISVVLKGYHDVGKFTSACRQQLCYFENIRFEGMLESLNNNFVLKGTKFSACTQPPHNSVHLILGQVCYPLDFRAAGIHTIDSPIALNFNIGELSVPPSRESIEYNDLSINLIQKRLKEAAEEIYRIKSGKTAEISSEKEFFTYNENYLAVGEFKVGIQTLMQRFGLVIPEPVFLPLKGVDLSYYRKNNRNFESEFIAAVKVEKGKASEKFYKSIYPTEYRPAYRIQNWVRNKKRIEYVSGLHKDQEVVLLKRAIPRTLKGYKRVLNLIEYPKNQWRRMIYAFQSYLQRQWYSIPDFYALDIPKGWGKTVENQSFPVEIFRYSAFEDHSIDKISNKIYYIYGKKQDKKQLRGLIEMIKEWRRIEFLLVNYSWHKEFEDKPNCFEIGEFMKGKNRVFKRMVTSYLISKFMEEHELFFVNRGFIAELSSALSEHMVILSQYEGQFRVRSRYPDILDPAVQVAMEFKYYDHEMMWRMKECKKMFDKLKDLYCFRRVSSYSETLNQDTLEFAIRIFKKRVRLNLTHYTKKD